MRQSIIFVIFIIALASCRHTADDISGSEDMVGKIYLLNPYDSFPPQIQPGQTVLLQRVSDSTPASYMFSTATNAVGEFSFKYLYKDKNYKLYAEARRNTRWDNDILFNVDSVRTPGKSLELTMKPDTIKQNGLFIICLDSVTVGTPGVIPRDSIYIYTSSVLAISDSTDILGSGASYRIIGNMDGKALKMNLPFDRPLFINSACTYGGKRYKSKYAVTSLRKSGIDTIWIRLKN